MAHNLSVKDLPELYETMGLPVEPLDASSGLTIHFLQETFTEFPFKSVPFRPNYFSFLFIREAFGKYTIDDQCFEVRPGTVYFTNPGNYRVFEWYSIDDTCLVTFNEAYLKENVHEDVYRDFSFLLTETVEPRVLSDEQFTVVRQLYQQIHNEYRGNSPYKNRIIGSLMVALLLKIKEFFFRITTRYTRATAVLRSLRHLKETSNSISGTSLAERSKCRSACRTMRTCNFCTSTTCPVLSAAKPASR